MWHPWREKPLDHIKDKPFAIISCGIFILTIIAMAFRPIFGYTLGFIAMMGRHLHHPFL